MRAVLGVEGLRFEPMATSGRAKGGENNFLGRWLKRTFQILLGIIISAGVCRSIQQDSQTLK